MYPHHTCLLIIITIISIMSSHHIAYPHRTRLLIIIIISIIMYLYHRVSTRWHLLIHYFKCWLCKLSLLFLVPKHCCSLCFA